MTYVYGTTTPIINKAIDRLQTFLIKLKAQPVIYDCVRGVVKIANKEAKAIKIITRKLANNSFSKIHKERILQLFDSLGQKNEAIKYYVNFLLQKEMRQRKIETISDTEARLLESLDQIRHSDLKRSF